MTSLATFKTRNFCAGPGSASVSAPSAAPLLVRLMPVLLLAALFSGCSTLGPPRVQSRSGATQSVNVRPVRWIDPSFDNTDPNNSTEPESESVELDVAEPEPSDSAEPFELSQSQTLNDPLISAEPEIPLPDTPEQTLNRFYEADLSFESDLGHAWPRFRDDGLGMLNWENGAVLGIGLATALAFRAEVDGDVREWAHEHPHRWGGFSTEFGRLGDPIVQVPIIAGLYGWSLWKNNEPTHDFATTLISAYTWDLLTTVTIKAIANTDRPDHSFNNGQFGFPSFHTSSTFAISAVVDERFGWKAGFPCYLASGIVGWSRIDDRDHDLSDVVFGAVLGWTIGKSVAGRHWSGDSRVMLFPYSHPTDGSPGIGMQIRY